jgi:hypothetical protein
MTACDCAETAEAADLVEHPCERQEPCAAKVKPPFVYAISSCKSVDVYVKRMYRMQSSV